MSLLIKLFQTTQRNYKIQKDYLIIFLKSISENYLFPFLDNSRSGSAYPSDVNVFSMNIVKVSIFLVQIFQKCLCF